MHKRFVVIPVSLLVLVVAFHPAPSHAAHPLITDDTGTQGAGKTQIELNAQYGWDRETETGIEVKEKAIEAASVISYGVIDTMDAVITIPYSRIEETVDGVEAREKGLGDISVEIKWRFYEKDGLSLGLKPGIIVPTGSERKGLGAGKYGFSTYLIATQEMAPWVFHLNLGYIRNNNRADEREDLYHVSLATEYRIKDPVRIVANIGQDHNPEKTTDRKPVFAIAGVIFEITEDFDVDLGIKVGLSDPETDYAVLAGMAWRF